MPEFTNMQKIDGMQEKTEFALGYALENLPGIVTNRNVKIEHNKVFVDAEFFPSKQHSQAFCYVTRDKNLEIHRDISPALLQFSVCMYQIRKTISETANGKESYLDYPFVFTKFSNNAMVLNNMNYRLQVEAVKSEKGIKASAKISSPRTQTQSFSIEAFFGKENSLFSDFGNPAYASQIKDNFLAGFGKIIGAESTERTLYTMSCFPGVLFDAVENKILMPEDNKVGMFYGSQTLNFDASTGPNPKEVTFNLYANPETFGKSIRNQDLKFSATKDNSRVICQGVFPLKFVRRDNLEQMIDRTRKFEGDK